MKKTLLCLACATLGVASANAYWLSTPVITSETKEDGKVKIEWTYDDSEEPCNAFEVIVYKMHKATADEHFVLASTDFSHIESKGTITSSEEHGNQWDNIPGCPGWWAKFPLYMDKALGIDTYLYFSGSDNSDVFGGAYLVSPDYNLSGMGDKTITVKASLAAETTSVSGGFAVWAWNTNWFDEKNIDYKPVYNLDKHYTTLAQAKFKDFEEVLSFPNESDFTDPDDLDEIRAYCHDRTRVMFYGNGYAAYWINSFEVSAELEAGDMVDYGASMHRVKENSFVIDTTGDTDTDYVYAYEVIAVVEEHHDFYDTDNVRAINYRYNTPKHVIGELAGVEDVVVSEADFTITTAGGAIIINGAEGLNAQVFSTSGACVYSGSASVPVSLTSGIYIVKVGNKTAKVIL
ncbi:MAG: T9SS type A sorting domain-containing protein [Muribaculaceae bacterium]|nr:T9SS type A sorting domain-containing protein [Muribaculaceae bacterium]